jgi:hypothetical protein
MSRFAFVLAIVALAGGIFASGALSIPTGTCADGTPYGKCSDKNPGQYCTGVSGSLTLGVNLKACPCTKWAALGWVQEGSGDSAVCVQAKCTDGTANGECSSTKPKMCSSGVLTDNATKCGCLAGKRVAPGGLFCESIPCTDGDVTVPEGTCSAKKQKKCVSGQLVDKASECGCPTGMTRGGEICEIVCSDGTKDGACSATKPKKCVNGYLIDRAQDCGCPDGLYAAGSVCSASILNSASSAELLSGAEPQGDGAAAAGSSNALSCCCLPAALIGIVGGFAFFRKD